MRERARCGLTLVETAVALSLAGGAFLAITAIVRASTGFYEVSSASMDLEARGSRLIHQVADALRATDLDSIAGLPQAPLCADALLFQSVEAYAGRSTTTTDPARITVRDGALVRTDAYLLPGQEERSLSSGVPDLFDGETFNGLDDNANGYVDEPGLFFARQDASIVVGLTLQSGTQTRSWVTRVSCRN